MAFNQEQYSITQSIIEYKQLLFNDINLSLRLTTSNGMSYPTRILRWDDTHITFYAPISQRDWVIFYNGDLLDTCFLTKKGIYNASIQIDHKFMQDNNLYYSATLVSPLTKKQQREHFRLDVLLPLSLKVTSSPVFSPEQIEAMTSQKGTTVNLSAGGMCLVCNSYFVKDTELLIEVDFLGQTIVIEGKVLGNGERNENGTHLHRVRFCNLDTQRESLISKLIFQKQRLQRVGTPKKPLFKK